MNLKMLSGKKVRTVERDIEALFSTRSIFAPTSIDDYKDGENIFARMLQLPGGRTLLLTANGQKCLTRIARTLHEAEMFFSRASYGDIWAGCRDTLITFLSNRLQPESVTEFLDHVQTEIEALISTYTFVVPLYGVSLDGLDALNLGNFRLAKPSVKLLDSAGVNYKHVLNGNLPHAMKGDLWLIGSAEGTPEVAESYFQTSCVLVTGMLAMCGCVLYANGARPFCIGTVMSSPRAREQSLWMSWDERDLSLALHIDGQRNPQFVINRTVEAELAKASVFERGFLMISKKNKSPLEAACLRALYWLSEAQRDQVSVMQLLKLWSCIETFFSEQNDKITKSVSNGLATVLKFGHFDYPNEDYRSLKRQITRLYSLRSKAVHAGSHTHVSEADSKLMLRWTAWLILNVVSFIQDGCRTPEDVRTESVRLDAIHDGRKPATVGKQ